MDDRKMPRFTPPTPRSKRLGRELRRLRDGANLSLDDAGKALRCSGSRIQKIEGGYIKARPGDVAELLLTYGVPLDSEQARELQALARELREPGWWQRLGTLSQRYLTYIGFEAEAEELRVFQPTLVPGLLQIEAYARAVVSVGRETEHEVIEQRVQARMERQAVLTREKPLKVWAILSETVLHTEVGSPEIQHEQLRQLVEIAKRPNISIQVLPFTAGAHYAAHGGFEILSFTAGDPPLGYQETLTGELFLESEPDISKLTLVFDQLKMLSLSPADSVRLIAERGKQGGKGSVA
jgi:transcriptional regulator with XRE-family HTH domain